MQEVEIFFLLFENICLVISCNKRASGELTSLFSLGINLINTLSTEGLGLKLSGKISNKYHDNGLSTTISNVKRDAMGNPISKDVQQQMNKLRKWDNRYKITSSRDRCLRNALFLLNELEERLFLPVHIVEEASSLYRRVIDSKLVGGRTIMGMVCACVYASCRINSMPISIREVAKSGFIRHRDVAMCYRIICKELDIQSDVIDPANNIPKIANKLGLDQSTISVASNIIKLAQKAGIVAGKNPMAIAAAAIYLSSILNNKPVTQKNITMASDITDESEIEENASAADFIISSGW